MIINPIMPIWLMAIICIISIILIIYHKKKENKKSNKKINIIIKIAIIVLLFTINLRFMIPDRESSAIYSDLNVLFVIDTSVSMRALDYNGNKERFEGVINDCCYIVNELSNCKFSIITFGDTAKRLIPFTTDTDMVQAELKAINLENDFYAKGSSMNLVKDVFEKTLNDNSRSEKANKKCVVFFVTDGEITKEGEKLESFSNISQYITNGAVLGYGTTSGGKMVNSTYEDMPNSDNYYTYYYDEKYNKITALSKLDEKNLKQMAQDMKIEYIQMDKTSKIFPKLKQIKQQNLDTQTTQQKINSYQDIYYYFSIPLTILLIVNFIIQKRSIM